MIRTDVDVAAGAAWLAAREARFADALALTGPLPLRLRQDGFAALLGIIVSQQVSVSAADAIWKRVEAAGFTDPVAVAASQDAALAACGLSRAKQRYARALAAANIDYPALRTADDAQVIARLTAVPGIGRWTAEIYALFALGRPDVFPAGDLALKESARLLFALPARPADSALRDMAGPWAPWRGVAARLLWAYYRVATQREGIR